MLPSNQSIEKKEKMEFAPLPPNVYQVELLDISLEQRPKYKEPETLENVYSFQFVLLSGKDKDGIDLRGRNVWANFVPSFFYVSGTYGKNALYKIVEGMLGREISQLEHENMTTDFINALVGKQVRVLIENKASKQGKVFSNINNYLPVETLYNALTAEEKEKATVKNKPNHENVPLRTKEDEEISMAQDAEEDDIRVENIPF